MFLAWGHTGPIQPWSSKSRPQQKLPTALCPLLRRPFYTMRRRREVGPGASSGFWTAPSANQRRPASRGAPPAPPRAVCPCTRKHRRAHAHTAEHTRVLRSGAGDRDGRAGGYGGFGVRVLAGVVIFGGVLHTRRCRRGWLGGDRRCGTWRFGDPGATRRRELHQGPATPPPAATPQLGHPKTHPRLPTGTLPPAGPNPSTVQGQGHPSPEHPLECPQEHPLRDPNPTAAPPGTTDTPNPSPKPTHLVFLALSFPLSPSFPSLRSLPSLPPWHGSTAVSTFEGATLVGKSKSSWTMIHNLPCNLGRV